MTKIRAHVVISGLVQGVFFRAYTKDEAEKLGLTGVVKNRWDGMVEAVFEGDKESVEKMINWCHKGPPHARVDNVEVTWEDYAGRFESFSIGF